MLNNVNDSENLIF